MVERRTITLSPEQLQALASEPDPRKREKLAENWIFGENAAGHFPHRPSNGPSTALQEPTPGGTTYRRAMDYGSPTPQQIESSEASAVAHGIHDPNPRFAVAAREVAYAREHQRDLHEAYFPQVADEVTARREGQGAPDAGREGPPGPDTPDPHGPSPDLSAATPQSALDDYKHDHVAASSYRFAVMDSSQEQPERGAEIHQRQAHAEHETQQSESAAYFEQRAQAPVQEIENRIEKPDRSLEKTDKDREWEARRDDLVSHLIARSEAQNERDHEGPE